MTTLTRYVVLKPDNAFSYFSTKEEALGAAEEGDRVLVSHRLDQMEAWGEIEGRKRFLIPEALWPAIEAANP